MTEQMLTVLIEHYGYGAVFLAMAMESMHLPVPSELVLGFAGFLTYLGKFTFIKAVGAGWLGSFTGSILLFILSRKHGRVFILKWGYKIKLSPKRVQELSNWFTKYGPTLIIPWRLMPFIRTKASIVAGVLNMNFLPFACCSALGIALWCASAVALGRYLGYKWPTLLTLVINLGQPIIISIGVLALTATGCFWYWRRDKTAH